MDCSLLLDRTWVLSQLETTAHVFIHTIPQWKLYPCHCYISLGWYFKISWCYAAGLHLTLICRKLCQIMQWYMSYCRTCSLRNEMNGIFPFYKYGREGVSTNFCKPSKKYYCCSCYYLELHFCYVFLLNQWFPWGTNISRVHGVNYEHVFLACGHILATFLWFFFSSFTN